MIKEIRRKENQLGTILTISKVYIIDREIRFLNSRTSKYCVELVELKNIYIKRKLVRGGGANYSNKLYEHVGLFCLLWRN